MTKFLLAAGAAAVALTATPSEAAQHYSNDGRVHRSTRHGLCVTVAPA